MNDSTIHELISSEAIQQRVNELGKEISMDFIDKKYPTLISVLKGAFLFSADLFRAFTTPFRLEFIHASSYESGTRSSGKVSLTVPPDIKGKNLLIVDGIIDTGLTIHSIIQSITPPDPATLSVYTLLDKPARRKHPVTVNYSGFTIPDTFVVGYGCDYNEQYRHLPFIATLQ